VFHGETQAYAFTDRLDAEPLLEAARAAASAVRSVGDAPAVVGVAPSSGDDPRRSLEAGRRVALDTVPATIADGLQATTPGALTFEVNCRLVDGIVTVTDEEIVGAMRLLFERMKLVVEPSGAVGVAALLAGKVERVGGTRVGVILSGGNMDVARFRDLMS